MRARAERDWKVSTAYRILTRIGWGVVAMALYFAGAATVLDSVGVWWIVAGLGVGGMLVAAALPEPVPRDYISGAPTMVDTRQKLPAADVDEFPFAA
jgi:hypothetical protein